MTKLQGREGVFPKSAPACTSHHCTRVRRGGHVPGRGGIGWLGTSRAHHVRIQTRLGGFHARGRHPGRGDVSPQCAVGPMSGIQRISHGVLRAGTVDTQTRHAVGWWSAFQPAKGRSRAGDDIGSSPLSSGCAGMLEPRAAWPLRSIGRCSAPVPTQKPRGFPLRHEPPVCCESNEALMEWPLDPGVRGGFLVVSGGGFVGCGAVDGVEERRVAGVGQFSVWAACGRRWAHYSGCGRRG